MNLQFLQPPVMKPSVFPLQQSCQWAVASIALFHVQEIQSPESSLLEPVKWIKRPRGSKFSQTSRSTIWEAENSVSIILFPVLFVTRVQVHQTSRWIWRRERSGPEIRLPAIFDIVRWPMAQPIFAQGVGASAAWYLFHLLVPLPTRI